MTNDSSYGIGWICASHIRSLRDRLMSLLMLTRPQGAFIGIVYAFLKYIHGGAFYVNEWDIRAGDMINLAYVRVITFSASS